jgi:hypothetical protein
VSAEFFLHLFLSEERCDNLVGDLDERYAKKVARLGERRTAWWYRKQVFTSVWPLFRDWVRRGGSAAILNVLAFGLRLFGQGAVADELKKALGKRQSAGRERGGG